MVAVAASTDERQPTLVHCADCGTEWIGAWVPAPVEEWAAELLRNRQCPSCGGDNAMMGRAPEAEAAAHG